MILDCVGCAVMNHFVRWMATCQRLTHNTRETNRLAKYTVSLVISIVYLITNDINILIAYYVYSIVLISYNMNWVFLVHHLATLVCITIDSTHQDYKKMMIATYWLKLGDLCSYVPKIVSTLNLTTLESRFLSKYASEWSMLAHVYMSAVYRVLVPFVLYPFASRNMFVIAVGFHITNVWWVTRIINKFKSTSIYSILFDTMYQIETYPAAPIIPPRENNLEF